MTWILMIWLEQNYGPQKNIPKKFFSTFFRCICIFSEKTANEIILPSTSKTKIFSRNTNVFIIIYLANTINSIKYGTFSCFQDPWPPPWVSFGWVHRHVTRNFFRVGEFSWNLGTLINFNNLLQHKKERPNRKKFLGFSPQNS